MIKKGFHCKMQIDEECRIVIHTVKKNSVVKTDTEVLLFLCCE